MRKLNKTYAGQSLVEFALLATLLIPMLLGVVDFGRAYSTQVQIRNAVADAGYFMIQNAGKSAQAKAMIVNQMSGLSPAMTTSNITICSPSSGMTKIKVSYQYTLLFSWIVPNLSVSLGNETSVPQIETDTSLSSC
jgi:Flp pilus assembly protein TadG